MHVGCEEMLELSPIRSPINSINLSYTARTCITSGTVFPPSLTLAQRLWLCGGCYFSLSSIKQKRHFFFLFFFAPNREREENFLLLNPVAMQSQPHNIRLNLSTWRRAPLAIFIFISERERECVSVSPLQPWIRVTPKTSGWIPACPGLLQFREFTLAAGCIHSRAKHLQSLPYSHRVAQIRRQRESCV